MGKQLIDLCIKSYRLKSLRFGRILVTDPQSISPLRVPERLSPCRALQLFPFNALWLNLIIPHLNCRSISPSPRGMSETDFPPRRISFEKRWTKQSDCPTYSFSHPFSPTGCQEAQLILKGGGRPLSPISDVLPLPFQIPTLLS